MRSIFTFISISLLSLTASAQTCEISFEKDSFYTELVFDGEKLSVLNKPSDRKSPRGRNSFPVILDSTEFSTLKSSTSLKFQSKILLPRGKGNQAYSVLSDLLIEAGNFQTLPAFDRKGCNNKCANKNSNDPTGRDLCNIFCRKADENQERRRLTHLQAEIEYSIDEKIEKATGQISKACL